MTPPRAHPRRPPTGVGAEVVHDRVNGGGHEAPRTVAGRPIARVLWEFFAAHPLPG